MYWARPMTPYSRPATRAGSGSPLRTTRRWNICQWPWSRSRNYKVTVPWWRRYLTKGWSNLTPSGDSSKLPCQIMCQILWIISRSIAGNRISQHIWQLRRHSTTWKSPFCYQLYHWNHILSLSLVYHAINIRIANIRLRHQNPYWTFSLQSRKVRIFRTLLICM